MSLKFALLGLVSLRPMSGYEIKQTIERSIFYIWNVTGAQIYNTIKTLQKDGLIESEDVPQRGKPDKQIHSITEAGRAALADEGSAPIKSEQLRDKVLLRIFFGNFAAPGAMDREIDAYMDRIRDEIAYLESVERRVTANPGTNHEARHFQLLSLRLKVAQLRATLDELLRSGYGQHESGEKKGEDLALLAGE